MTNGTSVFSLYVYILNEAEHLYRHLRAATISYSVNCSFLLPMLSIGLLAIFFLGTILGIFYILGILVLCDMLQTFFQRVICLLTFLYGVF